MRKEAIAVAETVLEAQQAACKELGVETVDAQFEVLQMPEKKRFGIFGGCPAKVRAYIEIEGDDPVSSDKDTNKATDTHSEEKSSTPEEISVVESQVRTWLEKILKLMSVSDLKISSECIDNEIRFKLDSENTGYIIGHRGDTLDALQYLANLVANTHSSNFIKVTLNVGSYKEKRERNIKALAQKTARHALRLRRKFHLKPMNSYERRIVHTSVQQIRGATSWSEGEEPNRHVIIAPNPKMSSYNNRSGSYNRDKYHNNNRKRPPSYGKFYDKDTSGLDTSDIENKVSGSRLYGKIK